MARMSAKRTASIPMAGKGWADAMSGYRVLASEEVEWGDILSAYGAQVQQRVSAHAVVVCLQETVELNFNVSGTDVVVRPATATDCDALFTWSRSPQIRAVSVASVALGATVVEKHFTLARADGGVDSAFSMEPAEMASLVVETERAWQALGTVSYGATAAEEKSKVFRRSLYIAEDMKAGEVFTPANLRAIRPGFGLPPKFIELVMGKTVKHDVKKGTPLSWDLLV